MSSPTLILLLILFQTIFSISVAAVPASNTFKFVNTGDLGDSVVEHGGNYRGLDLWGYPFQLCFHNTTPNAFVLAIRIGTSFSESIFRWVWQANRNDPVGEDATLTFGADGNLVLADADGRVAWQTNTSNKGVVAIELLENGNMVLKDGEGKFVWQSFDYPTDTLMVGQSLKAGVTTRLISRASANDISEGKYSMVLEPKNLAMYYTSPNTGQNLLYFTFQHMITVENSHGDLDRVTFGARQAEGQAYDLTLTYQTTVPGFGATRILDRPKYNAALSFLRLDLDGNLKVYTFDNMVPWGAWEITYTLFDRESSQSECQLPERCGKFGLCEDNQCIACPLPKGLMGWGRNCEPVKLPSCKLADFSYYKVVGVDHFVSKYSNGDGPITVKDCGKKCSKDCKCMGYFYHVETSRCWLAYELKTLTRVENSTHVGFIKMPRSL